MEMKKEFIRKLWERNGASILIMMLILSILITVNLAIMEYFRVKAIYDAARTEMERAANISVEYAMIDEARSYHISKINPDIARQQFELYFEDRLDLTDDFEKQDEEGNMVYMVIFDDFTINGDAPSMKMQGKIRVSLNLVGEYLTAPIDLPFRVATRNVNIVD
jgi:hypothetical protein